MSPKHQRFQSPFAFDQIARRQRLKMFVVNSLPFGKPLVMHVNDSLPFELLGNLVGDLLISSDRRMHMIDEPIVAGDAVAAEPIEHHSNIDHWRVRIESDLTHEVVHRFENPQRTNIQFFGANVLGSGGVELAERVVHLRQVVSQSRMLIVDRQSLTQQPQGFDGLIGVVLTSLLPQVIPLLPFVISQSRAMLGLEWWRVAEVARGVHQDQRNAGLLSDRRHSSQIEFVMRDNATLPHLVPVIKLQAATIVEQCLDLGWKSRAV